MLFRLATILTTSALILTSSTLKANETSSKLVWESNADTYASATKVGNIHIEGSTTLLNGKGSLVLPVGILGSPKDYTLEFQVKLPAETTDGNRITLISNMSEEKGAGFSFVYNPPSYNACWLMMNGYNFRVVEYRRFLKKDEFVTVTLVMKNGSITLFRNGLLLATTEEMHPSELPLSIGKIQQKATKPYAVKNIKIYDGVKFPDSYDESTTHMRYYGGDHYNLQRVDIKDPSLPRILIIGDSISMGYRKTLTQLFEGRANLDYWTTGTWHQMIDGSNSPLERAFTGALSHGPYDLVTFNIGLHSWQQPHRSPEDKYPKHATKLAHLVTQLAPDTEWIWLRTTPITKTLKDGRRIIDDSRNDRIVKFNAMTDPIMEAYGITVIDLYGVCTENLHLASPDTLHWKTEAYDLMGKKIAKVIEAKLHKLGKL